MPFRRHVGFSKDRGYRTGGHASIAVCTGCGIYVHLLVIGATLDAINGTNIDARQVFGADARLAYHVGQTSRSPWFIACNNRRLAA